MSRVRFLRISADENLPATLARDLPDLLWIPAEALGSAGNPRQETAMLTGECLETGERFVLASRETDDGLSVHFNVPATISGILHEQYHEGLGYTTEFGLPFNYSRLPNWIKAVARSLRRGNLAQAPRISFPDPAAPFVVQWLEELARCIDRSPTDQDESPAWPNGNRAALVVTHDVDTDWLFHNEKWLERICDIEQEHDLHGAWYCVPKYSQSPTAERALARLSDRGCEIGCHGYNHDAKWPRLKGREFAKRLEFVRAFKDRWQMRGFRSEWLWRTPEFMTSLSDLFEYDSSVPSVSPCFTRETCNGCGSCVPYRRLDGMFELPLTLPMDDDRILVNQSVETFWQEQVAWADRVIERGGVVVLTIHPQPHQSANDKMLAGFAAALREITRREDLWLARPDEVIDWMRRPCPQKDEARL